MRIKTGSIIIISLIIAAGILIAGCTPARGILPGKKCDIDSDCGQPYCSENQRKAVSPTCLEGRCEAVTTECAESDICVQDSLGVKCAYKDPDTNKPVMGCSINTTSLNTMGIDAFNPAIYMCGDDCPADSYCTEGCYCEKKEKISCSQNTVDTDTMGGNLFNGITFMCTADCPGGYYCDDSCYCEEKEEISCSQNTEDTDTFGENLFNAKIEWCADDCPRGSLCAGDCICDKYQCPDPVYTPDYGGDFPYLVFGFESLYSTWLANPRDLLELGDLVDIAAYEHYRDGRSYYIPFPEVQLTLVPNPDNEYIHKEGWEGYCVNDYYDGQKALDIDFESLTRQDEETCYWGGRVGFEGVLTVCPEFLIDWFEAFDAYAD